MSHQRQFFDELAKKLEIKTYEDWYNVEQKNLQNMGGYGLLNRYNKSLIRALTTGSRISSLFIIQIVYPDYPWQIWRFSRVSKNFWDSKTNQRDFFDSLGKHLGVYHWEDWLSIKTSQVLERNVELSLYSILI